MNNGQESIDRSTPSREPVRHVLDDFRDALERYSLNEGIKLELRKWLLVVEAQIQADSELDLGQHLRDQLTMALTMPDSVQRAYMAGKLSGDDVVDLVMLGSDMQEEIGARLQAGESPRFVMESARDLLEP